MNGMPERNLIRGVAALLLLLSCVAAVSAGIPGDVNSDCRISVAELSGVIHPYMKATYLDENIESLDREALTCAAYNYLIYLPRDEEPVDTLHLGLQLHDFSLMNAFVPPWYDDSNFCGFTHLPLVIFNSDMSIAPCLAQDWEISPDGRSITFTLVEGARWHDGMPVTPEDVAFSFEYWKEHILFYQGKWLDTYLDRTEVVGDRTVIITFNEPVAATTLMGDIPATYIVPKHVWETVDDPKKYNGPDALVGCGPFVFDRYDQDAGVAYLNANRYHSGGVPAIDRIEWRYFRTIDSLAMALKKGEIDAKLDYYNPVPWSYASDLAGSGVNVGSVPDIGVPFHLVFGYRQHPAEMPEFREAISYAIDYQGLADTVTAGYGHIPGQGYLPTTVPGYDPSIPSCEYNLTKAKEILDAAGFVDTDGDGLREGPDGKKLRIPITPYLRPLHIRCAEVLADQLKETGLDIYVESLSAEEFKNRATVNRDYTMLIGLSTPYVNMAAPSGIFYYVDMPGRIGTCTDPDLVDLTERILFATDIEGMKSARSELQRYVARERPIIPLIWADPLYPYRTDKWAGWVPMNGYGPCNYWSWMALEPVA
jgi:peptide/nickel transport system substrate-binding protein